VRKGRWGGEKKEKVRKKRLPLTTQKRGVGVPPPHKQDLQKQKTPGRLESDNDKKGKYLLKKLRRREDG